MTAAMLGMPSRRFVVQATRFAVVGAANTATCLGIVWVARVHGGLPVWLASALGYTAATALSYMLNRYWTFADAAHGRPSTRIAAFVLVNAIAAAIFAGLVTIFERSTRLEVATLLTLLIVVPLNFLMMRELVFRAGTAGRR